MLPRENCAAELRKFVALPRIIRSACQVSEDPGLEHFGERSAIRSNTNSLQYNVRMMAIFLGRILLFDHGIATACRRE